MRFFSNRSIQKSSFAFLTFLVWLLPPFFASANPTGGTVAQGAATFNSSSSQLTINAANNTFINWQSFNIAQGETTTFVQPSSTSLVWNQINDSNPSQILGNLNANGYVVLQNQSGFYIGGQASISAHGLILTTTPTPMPNLSSGDAWSFNTPPPSAKIINYGQINITGGGSAFLIASDIENVNDGVDANSGTISAPGGKIGLYAGEKVLVSTSPDGRGLSAQATIPSGLVNNQGQLTANAGSIVLNAQTVNQGGLIQANSVQNINGTIELVASDSLNLQGNSTISANGDSTSPNASPGGFVVLKSGNSYADTPASTISVSGQSGGQDGIVEIFGYGVDATTIQSSIGNNFALLINPYDITLSGSGTDTSSSSPNFYIGDLSGYSQIDLHALDNIELSSQWTLTDPGAAAALNLTAGNNLILDDGTAIIAKNNWSVNMTAGEELSSGSVPASGDDGIYLNGSSYIQAQNGGINLYAANEIIVNSGAVRTLGGGGIDATAVYGDVNTGSSVSGFNYINKAPYFTPFSVSTFNGTVGSSSTLGGISTAGGGDVTINAGGDVISYLPIANNGGPTSTPGDPGTGAFGSQAGNVTINAGGSVVGHFVVVNGTGIINAGQDIGNADNNVALSLVTGSWNLDAPNGNIYLQEVRNPNGVFNATQARTGGNDPGTHLFDYDSMASVDLTAGDGVYLTGQNLPRTSDELGLSEDDLPILLPPTLDISAGSGGITLENNFALFPSSYGELQITTTGGGDFSNGNPGGPDNELWMSDSSATQWTPGNFSTADHGSVPPELNNYNPVLVNISGSMENILLQTTKETQITIGGDMIGCSFYGQNLHAADITSINVNGQISNPGSFNFITLNQGIQNVPLTDLPPNTLNNWQALLTLAVNPDLVANTYIPASVSPSQYAFYVSQMLLFGNSLQSSFAYDPTEQRLIFIGSMDPTIAGELEQPLTVLRYGPNGYPLLDSNGHFMTDQITWTSPAAIQTLYAESQGAPTLGNSGGGYVVGGTGNFDIQAGSISLGNSYGILSLGNGELLGISYSYLTPYLQTQPGANINVTVNADDIVNGVTIPSLNMPSSTIAALGGGSITVTSTDGSMDLGSQYLVQFESEIESKDNLALGIYTSGGGDVNVTAKGSINIDSSRVATFDGGNVTIESYTGDINAGSGGSVAIPINVFSPYAPSLVQPFEQVYANGIVAETLVNSYLVPGSSAIPGNITVTTPEGSIYSSLGGILQIALNGNIDAGPTVTLTAGSPGYIGNIDLSDSGVIGGTVNVEATGKVSGLVISRQDSNVNADSIGGLTVLAGRQADVSGKGGGEQITIIGGAGVNANGLGSAAVLLGQNVSVNGGGPKSTLGSTAAATSTSQSAAGTASNDAKQQVVADNASDDKNKQKKPVIERTKRVTVILPKSS